MGNAGEALLITFIGTAGGGIIIYFITNVIPKNIRTIIGWLLLISLSLLGLISLAFFFL